MGEPDSNGWSGTPGDSPQPTHTICVLYQVLYFFEKILGENLVKRSQWIRTTIRSAQICNAESNRFASRNQSRTSFVPLLYHILRDLSRGFLHFFSMTGTCTDRFCGSFPASDRSPCPFGRGALYLPLTPIVYHRPHTKSIGNVAQIREKMRPEVCANCELTKSERCDIMEILPGAFDLGQPK